MSGVSSGLLPGATSATGGNQPEHDPEQVHAQRGDDEVGYRDAEQRDVRDQVIRRAPGPHGREYAQAHGHRNQQQDRDQRELQRVGAEREQLVRDRLSVGDRRAEVTREESREPVGVARGQRVVEVVLLVDRLDLLRRRARAEDGRRDVPGELGHRDEDGDREDRGQRDRSQQAAQGVAEQWRQAGRLQIGRHDVALVPGRRHDVKCPLRAARLLREPRVLEVVEPEVAIGADLEAVDVLLLRVHEGG